MFPQFNGNFLLDEEGTNHPMSSSYVCRYLQMHTDDDKFPILVRRDSFPGMVIYLFFTFILFIYSPVLLFCKRFIYSQLSASSAALDLAPLPQSTSRHRGCDSSDRKKLDNLTADNNISTPKQRVPKLSTSYSTPDLPSATRVFGCRPSNFNASTANDILLETDNQTNHSVQLPSVTAGDIGGNNVCRFYQQGYCQRGDRCSYSHTFNGLGQVNVNLPPQFPGVVPPVNNNAFYNQYGLAGIGGVNMLPSTSGFNYNQNLALNAALNGNMRLMHANNMSLSKMNQKRMSGDLEGKYNAITRFKHS